MKREAKTNGTGKIRFFSLAVLLTLVLAATGCGESSDSGNSSTNSSDVSSKEETQSDDTSSATTADDASNDTATSDSSSSDSADSSTDESNDGTQDLDLATKNAYKAAKNYLNYTAFSRQGLIDQLSSEYGDGYTVEQATAAVDLLEKNGEVDWNEQAVKSAQSYLDTMSFSRQGLIDQLSSDSGSQFTQEQAEYAADQVGL